MLLRAPSAIGVLLAMSLLAEPATAQHASPPLFHDDFEAGLEEWVFPLGSGHALVPAPGRDGRALQLEVEGVPVSALIRGSEAWTGVRLEGAVLFPDDDDNYLGFVYAYRDDPDRIDFGSLYIKGNGSYVQGNTHRDTNVGRTYLPEFRTDLTGPHAIEIGQWTRFALEVIDGEAHLYVGDLDTPVMTMTDAGGGGAIGLKPRNPGAPVLVDDIVVTAIDAPSYEGPPVPAVEYRPGAYLTDWETLGLLESHDVEVEAGQAVDRPWLPAPVDQRGAVRTADVTDFLGPRRVAYFRTTLEADEAMDAVVAFSTVDDVAIWLNGTFLGFAPRQSRAWWDAAWNDERDSLDVSVSLRPGENQLLVRIVGGVYATGGFYAWLEEGVFGTVGAGQEPATTP